MSRFKQLSDVSQNIHFSRALFSQAERSRMTVDPLVLTTLNAGDIVPVYCREVLPEEELSIGMDFVLRQTTLLTPTMGNMKIDYFAFFVPNRIVNQSFKAVEGENLSGSWTANQVSLAPLKSISTGTTQVPVRSVADYYGFPTQKPIPNSVLSQCHDLKFRGYVMIYNEFFRDQNYQPPIPMSTLNVYQGFFDSGINPVPLGGSGLTTTIDNATPSDGSFGAGAVKTALFGSSSFTSSSFSVPAGLASNRFRALSMPLKANKLHDYFTTVLPSPQKSPSTVFAPVTGQLVIPPTRVSTSSLTVSGSQPSMLFKGATSGQDVIGNFSVNVNGAGQVDLDNSVSHGTSIYPSNLATFETTADVTGLAIDVADIRMASAIQQVYETLARGGSRYREIVSTFFGVDVDDPFSDVPVRLGWISRDLELYQSAQTSASETGSTPQGNLAGFGYTANSGFLFKHRFLEHGYLHIFAVVRHRNIYASYLARDNFRLNMLDFYLPQLANISEQPVYAREINPFSPEPNNAFGYQEAWAEYRFEPDIVTGDMRTQPEGVESLSLWNYADNFDSSLQISNSSWLISNSEEVLNRSLAVTSALAPQFKLAIRFHVDKTLPMPSYSIPGMDII